MYVSIFSDDLFLGACRQADSTNANIRIVNKVRRLMWFPLSSSREFHISGIRMWLRDRLSFLAQSIQMKGDRFSHVLFNFPASPASRDTSWEIRGVGRKAGLS